MPEVANELVLFISVALISTLSISLEMFLVHIFIKLFRISVYEHKFNLISASFVSVLFFLTP